jgi:hypothetical protein
VELAVAWIDLAGRVCSFLFELISFLDEEMWCPERLSVFVVTLRGVLLHAQVQLHLFL